jgi:Autotransporter beta-domain
MKLRNIAIASALVAGSVFSVSASAQSSVNVTVNGTNYTVTETALQSLTTSLANTNYALTSQVWYGNPVLAGQFASAVQYSLGNWNGVTNPNTASVLFLTDSAGNGTVAFWRTNAAQTGITGPGGSFNAYYAYITSYVPSGPLATDTQISLQNTANALKGAYALQTASITNGLTYDCNVFDKEGICVSAGGRYDRVNTGDTHATNGLLIGSYKVDANTRVGAWVDQNLSASSATGVNLNNGNPLFGVFGVWNADKSGNGFEARLSAGYGDKDLTTTRQVVGTSEAGTGKTRLNTQGVSAVVSYNFPVAADLTLSPYLGARYTRVNANGYTEATSSAVTAPLTLSALKQETTTALAGLKVAARMSPECGVFGSVGAELDTNNQGNNYSATGVTGLTAIALNPDTKRLRGVASVGTYYDLDKTQRISLNAVYREEAFQKVNTLSTMATYTAGF